MKRLVDGEGIELPESPGYEVRKLSDRLVVRGPSGAHSALVARIGETLLVSYRGRQLRIERATRARSASKTAHSGEIHAPMPGLIVDVPVSIGQSVRKGDRLFVLEAMKTQQSFAAPFDGCVTSLEAKAGLQVVEGTLLAVVSSDEP
jgi:acetyl/propionyl-CoA carboxylase alpha subunit